MGRRGKCLGAESPPQKTTCAKVKFHHATPQQTRGIQIKWPKTCQIHLNIAPIFAMKCQLYSYTYINFFIETGEVPLLC